MNNITAREQTRVRIHQLEDKLKEMEQIDFKVVHHHAPGLYGRELFIPAGAMLVGKIHKQAHLTTLLEGTLSVTSEFGSDELTGPHTWLEQAGTKKAGYAQTDCRIINWHPTDETDVDKIESEVITPDYSNLLEDIK